MKGKRANVDQVIRTLRKMEVLQAGGPRSMGRAEACLQRPRSVGSAAASRRAGSGPEFTAEAVRSWPKTLSIEPPFIEPGSPWENIYPVGTSTSSGRPRVESLHGKSRDELLNREVFDTFTGAQMLIEGRRRKSNTLRSHSALGYRPPALEAAKTWGAY